MKTKKEIQDEINRLTELAQSIEESNDQICDNYKPEFLGTHTIEENTRKSWALCVEEDAVWSKKHDFYEVTEWANGEGWDIVSERSHSKSQISLHFTDLEALLKLLMTAGAITDNQLLNKKGE